MPVWRVPVTTTSAVEPASGSAAGSGPGSACASGVMRANASAVATAFDISLFVMKRLPVVLRLGAWLRQNHFDLDEHSGLHEIRDLHGRARGAIGLCLGAEVLRIRFHEPGEIHASAGRGIAAEEHGHLHDIAERVA